MLDFCTVQDVKNLSNFAARFDDALEVGVKSVTENFNMYLRRSLEREIAVTDVFNIPRLAYGEKYVIWLNKRNIVSNSVLLSFSTNRDFTDNVDTLMENASYSLDEDRGRITLYGYLPRSLDGLRVTYTGGYPARPDPDESAMDCPVTLRAAAAEQCLFEVDRRINLFGGASNEATDDKKAGAKVGEFGILDYIVKTLQPYRKPLGG